MYHAATTMLAVIWVCFLFSVSPVTAGQIHDAAKNGDLEHVQTLVEDNNELLNEQDDQGKTSLNHAIATGHIDVAEFLIERGADVNLPDNENESPLHTAAALGDTGITRLLLEKGATSINVGGIRQMTPLHWACHKGHPDIVKILLEYGADTEAREVIGQTPLMLAAENRDMRLVDILVDGGADIEAGVTQGAREYTMLIIAAMYGFGEFIDFLIDRNAVIPQNMLNYTCEIAIRNNLVRLFEYVRGQGLDLAALAEQNPGLINSAIAGGSPQIVTELLKYGFDLQRKDKDGWTAMHYAATARNPEIIEFLVGRGLDLNARNRKGETAYNLARLANDTVIVNRLLEIGADTSGPQFPRLTGPYMGQTPPGDIPEMFMPGIVSGRYRAHSSIAFSPDGKEAYWTEMTPLGAPTPVMEMVGDTWTPPQPSGVERDPSFSPDGRRLYFIKVRPFKPGEKPAGERDGWECYWYMEKTDSGWSEPVSVGDNVNSVGVHWPCSVDKDYNLYFSQFADSMFCSVYRDGEYQKPAPLTVLFNNGTLTGRSPFIAPNGDYVLFSTDGGIHISFRKNDGTWTDRVSLGPDINASGENGSARVTPDGKYIFFVSSGENRPWGIYWVSSGIIDRLRKERLVAD